MKTRDVTFTLACLITAAALVGCSSSTNGSTDGTTDAGGTGKDSGSSTTKDGGSSGNKDSGTTGDTDADIGGGNDDAGNPDDQCAQAGSKQACNTCCAQGHQAGYQTYVQALLTCACKPGNCDTECSATACQNPPKQPDTACNTCINGVTAPDAGAGCLNDLKTACTADQDCVALIKCASGCK
jgi:hypothetical protein